MRVFERSVFVAPDEADRAVAAIVSGESGATLISESREAKVLVRLRFVIEDEVKQDAEGNFAGDSEGDRE